jgi:hypothetical protein
MKSPETPQNEAKDDEAKQSEVNGVSSVEPYRAKLEQLAQDLTAQLVLSACRIFHQQFERTDILLNYF